MSYRSPGFTLLELTIVLVVIALIAGAIVIGRDLIKAFEIRQTIAQMEQFNAAANTFKNKYGCLPGDCANASALNFSATDGDGNGTIGCPSSRMINCVDNSGGGSAGGYIVLGSIETSEYVNFWYHLSAASLIAEQVKPYDAFNLYQYAGRVSPKPKLTSAAKDVAQLTPGGWSLRGEIVPYFQGNALPPMPIHNFVINTYAPAADNDFGLIYPPVNVQAMDKKIDDGMPLSGKAKVWYIGFNQGQALPLRNSILGNCVNPSAPYGYNVTANDARCSIVMGTAF